MYGEETPFSHGGGGDKLGSGRGDRCKDDTAHFMMVQSYLTFDILPQITLLTD